MIIMILKTKVNNVQYDNIRNTNKTVIDVA